MEVIPLKNIVAGGIFLISGIFLFIGVHIPLAIHMKEISGWSDPPGRYGTALIETGGNTPLMLSVLLCILGTGLLLWGVFSGVLIRLITPLINEIRKQNKEYNSNL
jgi:hypothetical protein